MSTIMYPEEVKRKQTIGEIVEEDPRDIEANEAIERWVDGRGSYDDVYAKVVDLDRPLLERIVRQILTYLQTSKGSRKHS